MYAKYYVVTEQQIPVFNNDHVATHFSAAVDRDLRKMPGATANPVPTNVWLPRVYAFPGSRMQNGCKGELDKLFNVLYDEATGKCKEAVHPCYICVQKHRRCMIDKDLETGEFDGTQRPACRPCGTHVHWDCDVG